MTDEILNLMEIRCNYRNKQKEIQKLIRKAKVKQAAGLHKNRNFGKLADGNGAVIGGIE